MMIFSGGLKTIFFSLCILIGIQQIVLAQSYNFRHYQVESGLSYNSVICSLQDKNGFMWFGTKNGLNRFDGYRFKIYRNDPEQPGSLGHNFIHSLLEDEKGQLWIGTLKGLYLYDQTKDTFRLIAGTGAKDINSLKTDRRGKIWFIAGGILQCYEQKTGKLTGFENILPEQATSVTISHGGDIWVSTALGFLQHYQPGSGRFEPYNVFSRSGPALSRWIEKIEDTGDGQLFIGTSNQGIKLFNLRSHDYQDVPISNPDRTIIYARDFLKTATDEYWIATESGIFIYNRKSNKYTHLRNKTNDSYSLSDNAVYTLTKDKEGGIWCGTYFGGLSYYQQPYTSFDKFYPKAGENSLQGNAVREIVKDGKGNLWIGTEDAGLNKYNPKTKTFTNFMPATPGSSLSHSNIHGLAVTGNKLWLGTFEHGLDVFDINTSRVIKKYKAGPAPTEFKSNFIESLITTKDDELLIGTAFGLYRYNAGSDDFMLLNEVPGDKHYSALLEDEHGTIWAGTLRDGLYSFNRRSKQSDSYLFNAQDKNSLSSNEINGIFQDSDHNLWITTENGLNTLTSGNKGFKRYTTKDGFPSNIFYKILEDEMKNLWISTSRGLVHFNPKTEKIISFSKANGLLSDQFNYGSAFKDEDGQMYFGSVKGMISFNPERFRENKFISKVYITGFQVDNKELEVGTGDSGLSGPINFAREIRLSHHQSNLSIDFAALSFTAPEMTEYAFVMKGVDDRWTYLKTNRKVYFTDLSPGEYTFMVKASNSSGIWNGQITQLKIVIDPPFWASIPALICYGLALVALVFVMVRYYHKRLWIKHREKIERWEIQKEKELYHAKINFFTHVTHEIRTPLTLINGPLEEVIRKTEQLPALAGNLTIMKKNTDRLLELTNQLLDFRKTEQKGFNLSFVQLDVNELLRDTCVRFQPLIDEKKILMLVELEQTPLLAFADAEALSKIVSNLLDNALKYASAKVWIKTSSDENTFSIVIINDGNTIPEKYKQLVFEPFYRMESAKTKIGSGIGLSLAKSLAELHEGTLDLNTEIEGRTCFELRLPKHHDQEYTIGRNIPAAVYAEENEPPLSKSDAELPVILVVEDNPEIRTFITNILQEDFSIVAVENGEKALKALNNVSVQLIISDIMMPVMDGLELCKTIKGNIDYAHVPIVLLTAKNTLQSKIEGLEVGADAYIEKPFSPNHLLSQVVNLLTLRDKIKNHFAHSPLVHLKSMAYNKADEAFLDKLNDTIIKNMSNTALDVDFLADVMNMSRPTLYRKTKAISNLSPHELINITRLKHAALLLTEGHFKILKIASITGFSSSAQFARSFVKQFGMTPSEYAASVKNTPVTTTG